MESYDTILLAVLATLGLGMGFMLAAQMCLSIMHYAAIIFGGLTAIGFGVLLILRRPSSFEDLKVVRYPLAGFFIVAGAFALLLTIMYRRYFRVSSVFLRYATTFISAVPSLLGYVVLLLIFTGGLFALTVFELLAVWGAHPPAFEHDRVFHISQGPHTLLLSILVLVQLYWGLAFLKELCTPSN